MTANITGMAEYNGGFKVADSDFDWKKKKNWKRQFNMVVIFD